MKFINQRAELLPQQNWKKQIELAARTCYKSEDKIAEGTADEMVEMLISRKHYAMLEHGTIYLHFKAENRTNKLSRLFNKYYSNPYSRAKIDFTGVNVYITTNYRVIKENGWIKDLQYICQPTEHHVKRYTFRLTTSISIVRELLRHRVFSFANESTRYCNYSKDKFENGITYIEPTSLYECMFSVCDSAETAYLELLKKGCSPQQAREVLPLCTKSELIMTGFEDDWKDFLDKRLKGTTGRPHPDMVELAEKINSALCAEVLANSKPIQILLQNEEKKQKSQ